MAPPSAKPPASRRRNDDKNRQVWEHHRGDCPDRLYDPGGYPVIILTGGCLIQSVSRQDLASARRPIWGSLQPTEASLRANFWDAALVWSIS
jgi:hypothetical protein